MSRSMRRLKRCYNIADMREIARKRLPKGVFDYLNTFVIFYCSQ